MRIRGSVNPLAFNTKLLCVRGQPERKGVNHFRQRPLAAPFEGTFPYDAHSPAHVEKEVDSPGITPGIAVDFLAPKILADQTAFTLRSEAESITVMLFDFAWTRTPCIQFSI